jgi:pyrimidine-nucleoside phosphorylase
MFVVPLIERKRDGGALTPEQWSALVAAYTDGRVPDYQMSALLMAVLLRGLERQELAALTDAMLASGQRLGFDSWPTPRVDKHSTGGVGDKVSLVLAPLVAACGVAVPMMSGRGLGHTGGTLDKLEAIPGFRTSLSLAEAKAQVMKLGLAMIGQTPEIAPADRRLYALRDVTGTVEAIPLIAASIMSKKLAEGLNALVLDVKRGSGAFLPTLEQSLELARTMITLGEDRGCPTVALLTAMDRPLGRACGNALETEEAILTLRGEGPADLLEVTYALGSEMLLAAGIEKTSKKARQRLANALASGLAAEKFEQVIEAQGGNPKTVEDPSVLPQAKEVEIYAASRTGVVTAVEPRTIGRAIVAMGGGRIKVEDEVDPTVGFVITVKPGDKVLAGEPIASVFARDPDGMKLGLEALERAIVVGDKLTEPALPLISHRVSKHGIEELTRPGSARTSHSPR